MKHHFELNELRRCSDVEYNNALEDVRYQIGDKNSLMYWNKKSVCDEDYNKLIDDDTVTVLAYKNATVQKANTVTLQRRKVKIIVCHAEHNKAIGDSVLDDGKSKVKRTLAVGKGARVSLTHNLDTKHGLFNGAAGTIEHVLFENEEAFDNRTPYMALVKIKSYDELNGIDAAYFDHPGFGEKLIPISWIYDSFSVNGTSIRRKGLPLTLNYAMTIHKAQGRSLDKVVVITDGLETAKEAHTLFYVAITRAKKALQMFFK